jgi:hypothetical protein
MDKPSLQQFQLKVDGQIKDSFATFEAAQKAGVKIKNSTSNRASLCL